MREIWKYNPDALTVEEQKLGDLSNFVVTGSDAELNKFLTKFFVEVDEDGIEFIDRDLRSFKHLMAVTYGGWLKVTILRPDQEIHKDGKDNIGLELSVEEHRKNEKEIKDLNTKLKEAVYKSK
jgi:hypothetical protein